MRCSKIPSFEELKKPLRYHDPKYFYFKLISFLLRAVGTLSDGIRVGYDYGFDSGAIMNYIYENTPHGRLGIGKSIDATFLNQTTCKAFRSIKQIQKNVILKYLSERNDRNTFIVDLAAGNADYIYDVLDETVSDVSVLLCDISRDTLAESKAIARRRNLVDKIRYEDGDTLDPDNLRGIEPLPNLVIEVGLFGIIHDDERIKKHMLDLKEILNPDAFLFNVQTYNEQIEIIARALKNQKGEPCVWHLRPAELVISWAEEAGFKNPEVTMDPYNIYAAVLMRA